MAVITDYVRANTVEEALTLLQADPEGARLLAGGTDLLLKQGAVHGQAIKLIDISRVKELIGVQEAEQGIRIGAATKLTDIVQSTLLRECAGILVQGAEVVGSVQIRNLATLGGNLCNASPSADTAGPLLVLDAKVEMASTAGTRSIALSKFFVGPGETAMAADELLTAICFPRPPGDAVAHYLKHSVREAMDLASVGVSAYMAGGNGRRDARLALSAVAPVPMRVPEAEELLANSPALDEATIQETAAMAANACTPISDVRGSKAYRREIVRNLTARVLRKLATELSS